MDACFGEVLAKSSAERRDIKRCAMQLQYRAEYNRYISRQKSGDPRSNTLLGEMVKRGVDAQVKQLQASGMDAGRNGKHKPGKSCCNKENTGPMPNMGSAHIDKILQFIEGGAQNEAAFKKAQKKARQKQRKEEERRQREEEEEAQRRAEEERLRRERELLEQQRIKEELALQKQLKKKKKQPPAPPPADNKSKKKGKDPEVKLPELDPLESYEQTIPAMVTIKRIVENNNSPPTVTITLKGSTPDQDKLLYTLVNGHDAPITTSADKTVKTVKQQPQQQKQQQTVQNKNSVQKNEGKKKKKGGATNTNNSTSSTNNSTTTKNKEDNVQIQTSEIKVQLTIDQSFRKDVAKAQKQVKDLQVQNEKQKQNQQNNTQPTSKAKSKKEEKKPVNNVKKSTPPSCSTSTSTSSLSSPEVIDIPSIKLPPGITITKVSGPVANRKTAQTLANDYPDVPVSKSGVIVVDTEKLIQQGGATSTAASTGTSKKKKKKAKKAAAAAAATQTAQVRTENSKSEPRVLIKSGAPSSGGGIVTLKNPIFHPLSKPQEMPHMMSMTDQATISHGENGMVTIRRHRPVGFMPQNESPLSEYLAKTAETAKDGAVAAAPATTTHNTTEVNTVVTTAPSMSSPAITSIASTSGATVTCSSTSSTSANNPPILNPWQMPDTSFSVLSEERKIIRPPNLRGAQWPRSETENGKTPSVLQGLPGIQITRVPTGPQVVEGDYVEPPANVSIIRTGGCHVGEGAKNWAYPAQP